VPPPARRRPSDRDHDIAAIDDRRKMKVMHEVIHHIDGQADRLARSDIATPISPRPRREWQ